MKCTSYLFVIYVFTTTSNAIFLIQNKYFTKHERFVFCVFVTQIFDYVLHLHRLKNTSHYVYPKCTASSIFTFSILYETFFVFQYRESMDVLKMQCPQGKRKDSYSYLSKIHHCLHCLLLK